MLFYPGTGSNVGFDGPVASMRLKWLRESIEDGEYLRLLRSLGGEAEAQAAIDNWVTNWGNFSVTPDDMYAARAQVAARIINLLPVYTTYLPIVRAGVHTRRFVDAQHGAALQPPQHARRGWRVSSWRNPQGPISENGVKYLHSL